MKQWIVIIGLSLLVGCVRAKPTKRTVPPPPPPPSASLNPMAQRQALAQGKEPPAALEPSTLLVLPHRAARGGDVEDFHRKEGGKVTKYKYTRWEAVEFPGKPAKEKIGRYKDSKLFEDVQLERIYSIDRTPNDPLYPQQWDMTKISAPLAWDVTTTNDVVVAVIDTGVDFTHPDLRDNLWTGPQGEHGYTSTNGIVKPGGAEVHYHGTHVAGTIGATGNNGMGVAGINWRTKIMSLQFIQAFGSGSSRDAGLLIEKMIDLRVSGVNIRVSNNSWGSIGTDAFIEDLFDAAGQAGIVNICAAGNNSVDTDDIPFTPASADVESIVSVLASDPNDNKAFFSNYGIESTDLLAPGTGILSTRPENRYWALNGTSMASPHVAGAVAMLFALNPNLTIQQAKDILLQPASYDRVGFVLNSTGGGRLNLSKLWSNPSIHNPPPLNHPPEARLNQADFIVAPPGTTTVSVSATDPDGDALSFNTTVSAASFDDNWLAEILIGRPYFPTYSTALNYAIINTFPLALDQRVDVRFGVTDGKGGSARAKQVVWTYRDESKLRDLRAGILGFTTWFTPQKQFAYRLDVNTNIVRPGAIYGVELTPQSSPWSPCCDPPNVDVISQVTFPAAGPYSVRPYLMDKDGNFTTGPQSVIVISNSTLKAPMARLTMNTRRGKAPLEIVADLSQSSLGSIQKAIYVEHQRNRSTAAFDITNPVRRFTLTEPGIYEYEFSVSDINLPLWDKVVEFITVLPAQAQPIYLSILTGPLRVRITSEPGAVVRLEGSADLRSWSTVATVTNTTGSADVPITASGAQRFFRGLTP